MAIEIEHKFLVSSDTWRDQIRHSVPMRQAYVASAARATVRVRITAESAQLTLKGASSGIAQHEFEYDIPLGDAEDILQQLVDSSVIEKTRHTLIHADHEWVVDEFHGDNAGLVLAEIELQNVAEQYELPQWAGENVTTERRYKNKFLAHRPYSSWTEQVPL